MARVSVQPSPPGIFTDHSADASLSAAISAEHTFEIESAADQPEIPEFLESFKSQRTWKIEDTPGNDDVVLTRKFGNERYVQVRPRK